MSLPKELEKPIEKINNPILQILVIGMALIIVTLAGVVAYQSNNKDRNCKEENAVLKNDNKALTQKIESMYKEKADFERAERVRLQARDHYFDSVLTSLNELKKNVKE